MEKSVHTLISAMLAGGGVEIDSERVRGSARFAWAWLVGLRLNATKCAIIRMRGETTEPTLPDGCSVLFDRAQRDRREGGIYVVRLGEGWEFASDNPATAPEPWPADAEVVRGRVGRADVGWAPAAVGERAENRAEPVSGTSEGAWGLASDNPEEESKLWPTDGEVVGEVVWVAQTLIEAVRGAQIAGRRGAHRTWANMRECSCARAGQN